MAGASGRLQNRHMRSLLRASLPVLALPLALALTACGDDELADAPASTSTGSAATSPGVEDIDTFDEGLDQALSSTSLETIADALDRVLDTVAGYEIDGNAITLLAVGSSEGSSICTIAGTVLGSFEIPEGTTLAVEFDDGTVECPV